MLRQGVSCSKIDSDWGFQLWLGMVDRTGDDVIAPHERNPGEKGARGFGGWKPSVTKRDDDPILSPITFEHTGI